MANLIRRRVARVASFRCVGSSSSNPSQCWRPLDTAEPRPRIRFCRRRAGNHGTHRNTRKDDITAEGFISVCSVCSVVKKNGICSSLKDGTGNADVPRAALRFALGYLILPLWGRDTTTLSLCWLPLDIAVRQPRIRSYRRRSRRLRPGSVSAQGRSGNCECHDLRDARP